MSRTSRIAVAVTLLLAAGVARAAVPLTFTYSGFLTDTAGAPATAATTLRLNFYDALTAGTLLGYEDVGVVPNSEGYFSVIVGTGYVAGTVATFEGLFAFPTFMAVRYQGDATDMDPRVPLTSVPSAMAVAWTGVTGFPGQTCGGSTPFVTAVTATGVTCSAAPAGTGTITGVSGGTGLTGSGTSGTVTLAVDPTAVQTRVSQSCLAGSSIRVINQDGTVGCQPDVVGTGTVTSVGSGTGLTGGPITTTGTLSVDTTAIQARVTGTCASGFVTAVAQNGTVTCTGLPAGYVTSAMIVDGTIAAVDLAAGSVTSTAILDGTIATADLANASVTGAKIASGTITGANVAANPTFSGTVTATDFAFAAAKTRILRISGTTGTVYPSFPAGVNSQTPFYQKITDGTTATEYHARYALQLPAGSTIVGFTADTWATNTVNCDLYVGTDGWDRLVLGTTTKTNSQTWSAPAETAIGVVVSDTKAYEIDCYSPGQVAPFSSYNIIGHILVRYSVLGPN